MLNYARRQQYRRLSRAAMATLASGAVPLICVVRAHGVQRLEQNVLVVSIDRLIPVLRSAVGSHGMRGLFEQRNPLGQVG